MVHTLALGKEIAIGTSALVVVAPPGSTTLEVESVTLPDPDPHQVLVRTYATGVCHTQLHMIRAPRDQPLLLGHESTGRVLTTGSDVTHVQAGDDVVLTWVPRRGAIDRTPAPVEVRMSDGSTVATSSLFTWADHTLLDESFVVPLPARAPRDLAAILGCAVMTGASAVTRFANVRPGQSVVVIGVGGIGLSAVAAAAVVGASPIVAVDLDPIKLDKAREFGATHVVDGAAVDAVEVVHQLTGSRDQPAAWGRPGTGADFAFDCIGAKSSMQQAFGSLRYAGYGNRRGGCAVLVGVPHEPLELDPSGFLFGRTYTGTLGGSCVPDRDFPEYLRWYEQGRLDLSSLVSRRYSLSQVNDATSALASSQVVGRAIIQFDP